MSNPSILVVDDEPQIRRTLRLTLADRGCDVIEARSAEEAFEMVVRERPDLILLDLNMPEMNGLEACSRIRLSFKGPIIVVTARNAESDKIEALNSGADDYVVKPFSMEELLARIHAVLRRSGFGTRLPKVRTPEIKVDLENRTIDVRGKPAHLTPKEFDVLRALVMQKGKAVAYPKIMQEVWGPEYGEETEKLRVVIKQIRRKIEKDPAHPRYIVTEPWFGYRFEVPKEQSAGEKNKEDDDS